MLACLIGLFDVGMSACFRLVSLGAALLYFGFGFFFVSLLRVWFDSVVLLCFGFCLVWFGFDLVCVGFCLVWFCLH